MVNFAVHGLPVTIYRNMVVTAGVPPEPVLDEYQNPIFAESSVGTTRGVMSSISPMEVNDLDGRTETTSLMLIADPIATIQTGDKLEIDGRRYLPIGSPESWRRYRRQTIDHLEIPLKAGVT